VSWTGLTPTARQSGPRKGCGKKRHGNTYAKRIAVLLPTPRRTRTCSGRALPPPGLPPWRRGRKKAGCAVGRSILVIVWHLLKDRAARYRDLAPARAARPQKIKGISIFVDCWYSG
jgi:hypothetical protein